MYDQSTDNMNRMMGVLMKTLDAEVDIGVPAFVNQVKGLNGVRFVTGSPPINAGFDAERFAAVLDQYRGAFVNPQPVPLISIVQRKSPFFITGGLS